MKEILVTGAAGFIGASTVNVLSEQGITVVGVDNMNDYYDVQLKEYRLSILEKNKNFRFYREDIEDIQSIRSVFKKHSFDAVINLAARAGVRYSQENPFVYMTTNAMGTLNLLELMREFSVKKIVLASTSSLYAGQPLPFSENLDVSTPISPYAATKKAAEVMAYTYHYLYGIDVSICRYFTVYGPAGRPDMSPFRFIKWVYEGTPITLYGDGTQSRDFTYIEDIANGTVAALQPVGYEIFNLGCADSPVTLNKMIEMIENYTGKKACIDYQPVQKSDMTETMADITKAKKILHWQPRINFEIGLKESVDWYLKNAEWASKIKV
ncbi:MAG: SDR family NAD(P)-dependent oxidoreductase [Spirochaetales bacterium]|nr:SDR family NAD(P)-dependent oxidoreductase [Spirochaetales bacterium]